MTSKQWIITDEFLDLLLKSSNLLFIKDLLKLTPAENNYTKDDFLNAAKFGEVSMIDAKHVVSLLDEVKYGITQKQNMPLSEFEGELPFRAYRLLRSINSNATLIELSKQITIKKLKLIRDCGAKSISEIVDFFKDYGIEIPER